MSESTGEARAYLKELSRRTVERKGSIQILRPEDQYDHELNRLRDSVIDAIERTDPRTWRAPTAWHAAAWLRNVAHQAATEPITQEDDSVVSNGCLLFRGQRDSRWNLKSALERSEDPGNHMAAAVLFARIMSTHWLYEEVPSTFDETVHIGTAQHYGVIKTPLMDFTADPATALFFATHGAEDRDEAVVYLLPIHPALDRGLLVYLAPPWVQRIYRQRGVFIDIRGMSSEEIEAHCFRITFPVDHELISSGYVPSHEEIYPEDRWLEAACKWVLGIVRDREGEDWRKVIGEPPFKHDILLPKRLQDGGYYEFILDIIQYMALRADPETGTFHMDGSALAALSRQNSGVFLSFRLAVQVAEKFGGLPETWDSRILATLADLDVAS